MSFSAMFIASTGMQALGTGMQTISNNLANVNTVGYKTMRTNYQDLISETYYNGNFPTQVGKGSRVVTIQTIFNQGAFKNTGGDTDLAIAGEGFFNVRNQKTGEILYTRAGVYTFDKEGLLQDPSGNILQGWKMAVPQPGESATRMGSPVDIKINQLTVPPEPTTAIRLAVNLNAGDQPKFNYPATVNSAETWEGNGFAGAWNANKNPPIAPENYSHSEGLTIYDASGNSHTAMIYYQRNPHMENVWDYIITIDPAQDARNAATGQVSQSSMAGLIKKGKITFTANDDELGYGGLMKSLESQDLDVARLKAPSTGPVSVTPGTGSAMSTAKVGGSFTGQPEVAGEQFVASQRTYTITWGYKDSSNIWHDNLDTTPPTSGMTWEDDLGNIGYIPVSSKSYPGPYAFGSGLTVSFASDGLPMNFGTPGSDAITVTAFGEEPAWSTPAISTNGSIDFNLSFFNPGNQIGPPYPPGTPSLSQNVNLNMGQLFTGEANFNQDLATTTQFATKSSVTLNRQNGFPEGSLQRVSVTEDGRVVGIYSQNREVELYQINLTRFMSPWGLDKRGDNLFAKTRYSGEPMDSAPGEGGAGDVVGNFLEQSTVDTATEIVQMILTQRGFQANSKAITTQDTMIATAIQTKR